MFDKKPGDNSSDDNAVRPVLDKESFLDIVGEDTLINKENERHDGQRPDTQTDETPEEDIPA